MIRVFLVEDELVIRNGIKNCIDWEKEGYKFAGEASDGELAYPLILKEKPDILLTDIKMPFMDGLELSEAVRKELPDIKIIVLSGYNDFDYAKKAIGIGITDYLLKPVSAEKLLQAIGDVREVILKEREEKELLRKYSEEMQENVEREKHQFMTRLITEEVSMTEAMEEGRRYGMDLSAGLYNFLLLKLLDTGLGESGKEQLVDAFVAVEQLLDEKKQVYYFQRGVEGWALLCLAGDEEEMKGLIHECRTDICRLLQGYADIEYFGGIGRPVSRLRELGQSFREADRAFSGRFTARTNQIVSWEELHDRQKEDEPAVRGLGSVEANRSLIAKFLRSGTEEEAASFTGAYYQEVPEDNMQSMMMRQYIMMDIYISIIAFGESLELTEEEIQKECGKIKDVTKSAVNPGQMRGYTEQLLRGMLRLRDMASGRRYSDIIREAKDYIEEKYMTEEISLNAVSQSVGMSPSYFSAIFSQEAGMTFVEYLTGIRMEKAKELLMCSPRKTSEIGYEVGYKDPHYFIYIFKKTQRCTPKEYRARGKV